MTTVNEQLIETINTNISDHWGVEWNEIETARYFLQNFYDANNINDIKIEVNKEENIVSIFAPSIFDWKELIIFGSDKRFDDEKVGNYGEGFKASLLNAMRNFDCQVEIYVKDNKLKFYFESKKIGKTEKKLIMCNHYKCEAIEGTKLILFNCPPNLIKEFQFGLNYFYSENNPLFGDLITETYEKDISIFKSPNEKEGYLFYKKLLRAKLDIPLVIVCNRIYKRVDEKIRHDRDRKAFNDEVMAILFKCLFKPINTQYNGTSNIVNFLQPYWQKGHKILSIISDSVSYNYKMQFPENYYAKDHKIEPEQFGLIAEIDKVVKNFQDKGYICCPHYMSKLGMKTPEKLVIQKREEAKQKYAYNFSRTPTVNENKSLSTLSINF